MRLLPMLMLVAAAAPLSAQSTAFEAARGAAVSTGYWSYSVTPGGSEARFGTLFVIRCQRASRVVVLARPDVPAGALRITTDMLARSAPASGALLASDPLLDAIAFSRGRFLVDGGNAQRLVLPASPEAARSIEDCRN